MMTFYIGSTRREFYDAMDPSYVSINWRNEQPIPIANWNFPPQLQGNNSPVAVDDFPNCYSVRDNQAAHVLVGVLCNQNPNIRVFTWDLPYVLTCYGHKE